ncbi:MAG: hypothetical protein ABF271_09080, partial [Abyssibacter sp.]|uniref:hypothetical protein n=1 Tax=Abyssibacter sp. TaxID=2320200 RepID=UPI00321BC48B
YTPNLLTPQKSASVPGQFSTRTGGQFSMRGNTKGGVLTYHFDPRQDRVVGCWLNARPVAQLPDIIQAIRADVARERPE